jgi:hypothetical protein
VDVVVPTLVLELIDESLLLKLFAFENNLRFQKAAICSHGFEKASLSTRLRTFKEAFLLGSLLPITNESNPKIGIDQWVY